MMTEDPFDEDFFNIQNYIRQLNSKLVVIDNQNQLKKGNILTHLALQIKLYGKKIIELQQTLDTYWQNLSESAINDVSQLQSKIQSMEKSLSFNINQIKGVQHEFGQKNKKVNWKEVFQTLEEGFDSTENLMSSCEVLQLLDYSIDAQSFLGIKEVKDYRDIVSINSVYQQIINWLSVSNRMKDNSIEVLSKNFTETAATSSFFEQIFKLEEVLNQNKNENISLLKQKIEYLNSQLVQPEKITKVTGDMSDQKLQQDLDELLIEFESLKQRYDTVCEEFKELNLEFEKSQKEHEKQIKQLNEEKEFAEGLEEIEHLKEVIQEKDKEIEKLKLLKKQPSSSKKSETFNPIFMQKLKILKKLLKFNDEFPSNDNLTLEELVSEVNFLIDQLSANYKQIQQSLNSKETQIPLRKLENYLKGEFEDFLSKVEQIYQIIEETNQQMNTSSLNSPLKYSRIQKLGFTGAFDQIVEKMRELEKSYPDSQKLNQYLTYPRQSEPHTSAFNTSSLHRTLKDSIKTIKNAEFENQKSVEIKIGTLQNEISRQTIQLQEAQDFISSISRRLPKYLF